MIINCGTHAGNQFVYKCKDSFLYSQFYSHASLNFWLISCSPDWPWTRYIVNIILELLILLPTAKITVNPVPYFCPYNANNHCLYLQYFFNTHIHKHVLWSYIHACMHAPFSYFPPTPSGSKHQYHKAYSFKIATWSSLNKLLLKEIYAQKG